MANTVRTRDQLAAIFVDNDQGDITAQDGRDLIASAFGFYATTPPTAFNDRVDSAGIGAFFDTGSFWTDLAGQVVWQCLTGNVGTAVWQAMLYFGVPAGGRLTGYLPAPMLADTGIAPGTYGQVGYYPTFDVLADGTLLAAGEIPLPSSSSAPGLFDIWYTGTSPKRWNLINGIDHVGNSGSALFPKDVLYAIPIVNRAGVTIDSFRMFSNNVGGQVWCGVYRSFGPFDLYPDSLLVDLGAQPLAFATDVIYSGLGLTLPAGIVCWFVLTFSNASTQFTGQSGDLARGCWQFGGAADSNPFTNLYGYGWNVAQPGGFPAGLPTPFPAGAALTEANQNSPTVFAFVP